MLAMRLIFGISCLLVGMAMLSCRYDGSRIHLVAKPPLGHVFDPEAQTGREPGAEWQAAVEWVRTADGWERAASIYMNGVPAEVRRPQLHPLVVAAGQGLFSVLALVACQRKTGR